MMNGCKWICKNKNFRMNKFFLMGMILFLLSCSSPNYKNPHVLIDTNMGDIELELFPDKAPETVAAFLSNIDAGIYNNSFFYRVLKSEELPTDYNTGVIQGGTWQQNEKTGSRIPGIPHEPTNQTGLSHTDGVISMARKDTGTANTEFFICIGDQSPLDFGRRGSTDSMGYAAFGKVFEGMDIVRKIQNQKSHADQFDKKIEIRKIKRL